MKTFDYFEPTTLNEAILLLHKYGIKARILAGGTDLMVKMRAKQILPQYVINLKKVPRLDYIKYDRKGGLRIGALARLRDIEKSPIIKEKFPMVAYAASEVGSVQVRNLATLGGNMCNAAPSADLSPPLVSLSATVTIARIDGERSMLLEDFFKGPGLTTLRRGEILKEIQVNQPPPRTGTTYIKHCVRRAMDIAIVGVAVLLRLDTQENLCKDIKISLGAVAPTPLRAIKAEKMLRNKVLNEGLIREAALMASKEAKPITDVRGSAEYRTDMVNVITRRATMRALEMARSM